MAVASEIMTGKVVTVATSDNLLDVHNLLTKHGISRIVVASEGRAVGIVTEKDIVNFLARDNSRRCIEDIAVREVMSRNLITAKDKTRTSECAEMMIRNRISSIIVTDEEGKLEGILTKADLCQYYGRECGGANKVRDFMTKSPVVVAPSSSIFSVVSLMLERNISRVIVVDREQKPIGIVTLSDLERAGPPLKCAIIRKKPAYLKGAILSPVGIHLLTAREFMTVDPITLGEKEDLAEAARLMTRHGVSGLPVVDGAGRLRGIVTKSDITRAVASIK